MPITLSSKYLKLLFMLLKISWFLILIFVVHYIARKPIFSITAKTHVISAFLGYSFLIQGLFILYLQQFLKNSLKQGKYDTISIQILLQLHPKGIQTHNLTHWIAATASLIIISIISGLHYHDYHWEQLLNFKFIVSIIAATGLLFNWIWRVVFAYRGHLSYLLFEVSGICFILGHALFYLFHVLY